MIVKFVFVPIWVKKAVVAVAQSYFFSVVFAAHNGCLRCRAAAAHNACDNSMELQECKDNTFDWG